MKNSRSKLADVGFWFCFALGFCGAGTAFGTDWSQWGGTPSRNMVATGAGKLPCWFSPGVIDDSKGEIKPGSTANVRWVANTRGYPSPVVSQGRVIAGELQCFDLASGTLLWRGAKDVPNGFSSTATIDGDRVYTITSKGTVLCLDLYSEKKGAKEGIVIWSYDMKQLGVYLRYPLASSPLIVGDYLYVGTGNERLRIGFLKEGGHYCPLAPSLIVLNKHTGQLVAREDEQISARNYGPQWSSPSSGVVNGQTQIYYGGGDGVCYAFEPVDPAAKVNPDKLITTRLRQQVAQCINDRKATPEAVRAAIEEMKKIEQTTGIPVGEVRCGNFPPMSLDDIQMRVPDVPCLKKIWSCDCNPKEYKEDANGLPVRCATSGCPNSALVFVATPVFYKNKVYVTMGRDANEGLKGGNLVCIDATRKGDMKSGEWLWSYKINRSASTVSVADGLVYAVDFSCTVFCFDAETGKKYWEYHCVPDSEVSSGWKGRGFCYASPLVADGKLFIRSLKKLYIFATGREARLLGKVDISEGDDGYATPCAVGNTLLLSSVKRLWAVQDKGAVAPAPK